MATHTYTYSLATDFSGLFNSDNLVAEIAASSIVTALERIDTTGDVIDVVFKAQPSQADKTTLDGGITQTEESPPVAGSLLVLHNSTPVFIPTPITVQPTVGGEDIVQDGSSISQGSSTWSSIEYLLSEDLYLMAALICWENWKSGDYGFAAVTNPGAEKDLTAEATSGQATLELGSAPIAAYYNPAVVGKPVCVEIWSASGGNKVALIERRWVASVSGSVVTLDTNLTQTHAIGAICLPCYGLYSEVRGTDGTEGGIHLIGNGNATLGNTSQLAKSELVTTGLCFSIRIKTSATAATRSTSVTFLMRRPA
jgi:hypothetical protein